MMKFVAVVLCIQLTFKSAIGDITFNTGIGDVTFKTAWGKKTGCKHTERGTDYNGQLSETKSGKTCLNWATHPTKRFLDSANPTKYFAEKNLEDAVNYCRNGDNTIQGPWCYIDAAGNWEACDIPRCPGTNCKHTARGTDYNGQLSETKSGKTCLNWATHPTKQFLDPADLTKYFPEDNLADAVNYCRNGDNSGAPWCFTDAAGDWETCAIPDCPKTDCKQTERGTEYNGQLSVTKSGKTCLNWATHPKSRHLDSADPTKYFPENNLADAVNYCRNGDNTIQGPWCYIDKESSWEACEIPFCPDDRVASPFDLIPSVGR